eukprot:scaffold94615_cov60-Phaeocystis_antarctica.AAC.7
MRPASKVVCQTSMPCVALTSAKRAAIKGNAGRPEVPQNPSACTIAAMPVPKKTLGTTVIVHAIAPRCWALALSSQRCTATRAHRPRTRQAVSTTSAAQSDASPLLTPSEKVTNSPSQIISAIATMCNGIIIRNTLDLYATVCSESANVPVNGWIGSSAGGRSVSGLSSFSGSSLRAWSRGNSAEQELSVGAGIRLDCSRAFQLRGTVRLGAARHRAVRASCGTVRTQKPGGALNLGN